MLRNRERIVKIVVWVMLVGLIVTVVASILPLVN